MKKLLLVILTIMLVACGENIENAQNLYNDQGVIKLVKNNKAFSGKTTFYSNEYEGEQTATYKKGKIHGEWIVVDFDGKLKVKGKHKNGSPVSTKEYDSNGEIFREINFKSNGDGTLKANYIESDSYSALFGNTGIKADYSFKNYDFKTPYTGTLEEATGNSITNTEYKKGLILKKNIKFEGEEQSITYKDGKISTLEGIKTDDNGEITKYTTLFDESEEPVSSMHRIQGSIHNDLGGKMIGVKNYYGEKELKKDGLWKSEWRYQLDDEWKVGVIEANYKAGVLDGDYRKYFADGSLEVKATYDDGALVGEYIDNWNTGHIGFKAFYKKHPGHSSSSIKKESILHGEYIENHSSGFPRIKRTYDNGVVIMEANQFYGNGVPKFEMYYTSDRRPLKKIDYSEDGNIKNLYEY